MTGREPGSAPRTTESGDVDVAERPAPAPAGSGAGVDRDASGPIGIRCLACGSTDLDVSEHPRGDEPIRCRDCGEWDTYRTLEVAAVDMIRRELARRLGG